MPNLSNNLGQFLNPELLVNVSKLQFEPQEVEKIEKLSQKTIQINCFSNYV
jgi:hypothetical protein